MIGPGGDALFSGGSQNLATTLTKVTSRAEASLPKANERKFCNRRESFGERMEWRGKERKGKGTQTGKMFY